MKKLNCFILTGAPGSGKSTLINALRKRDIRCVDEPARQILAEQRLIDGNGVPERDPALFTELMLSRTTHMFRQVDASDRVVIFDRGIADNIAYATLFDMPLDHGWQAAKTYRFNPIVFFTPSWPEIYRTDDERKMSFELAAAMGDDLRKIYQQLGYTLKDVPCCTIEDRVDYLLKALPSGLFRA